MSRDPSDSSTHPGPRCSRRDVLRAGGGAGLAWLLAPGCRVLPPRPPPDRPTPRRLVMIRFGGGVRREDVFGDEASCLAPYLRSLAAESAFVPDLWNDRLTRHDCATAYMLTGQYGPSLGSSDPGDANLAELRKFPTLHEVYLKAFPLPRHRVLAAGTPSHHLDADYAGLSFGDDAKSPSLSGDPTLAGAAHVAAGNDYLLQLATDILGERPTSPDLQRPYLTEAAARVLEAKPPRDPDLTGAFRDSLVDRVIADRPFIATEEADEWLCRLTTHAMHQLRPHFVTIGLSTPDLAHRGAWSLYADAVRRNDQLLAGLIEFARTDPFYRDRTNFLIAPDVGRDGDRFSEHAATAGDSSGPRQLFLVGHGPSFRRGEVAARRQQVDVAATAAHLLGCPLQDVDGKVISEMLT